MVIFHGYVNVYQRVNIWIHQSGVEILHSSQLPTWLWLLLTPVGHDSPGSLLGWKRGFQTSSTGPWIMQNLTSPFSQFRFLYSLLFPKSWGYPIYHQFLDGIVHYKPTSHGKPQFRPGLTPELDKRHLEMVNIKPICQGIFGDDW